ncbi:hypothetical protein SAMN05421776_108201 [Nocardia farcinica]|uniref:Uncharacterized protein n=1 Tax=Nocardia farcinica TaxID=37329 RepID=A0A0H5NCL3_NOCFR|nr:hypothetical protein [Nocardia farcinica]AXK88810.1 hypothetical protein DXT66_27140 [Nocardia farcinica]MBA4858090.1 hypothetical protein [Nocardia farcinica]MBC9819379.1 hypothetical protein [Nocardia farcinica]PFX04075.1 hypothetical protein CJ469_01949 [Nocardia farcinica]PFX10233.1 hypothetical protein CJ468_01080 [Nocardia farcinica]
MDRRPRLYRTPKGWAEEAPSHCPHGHRFTGGCVLVGHRSCKTIGRHRTHTCLTCLDEGRPDSDATVYTPPLTADCDHTAFDERSVM